MSLEEDKQITFRGNWDDDFHTQSGITRLTVAPDAPVGRLTLKELRVKP